MVFRINHIHIKTHDPKAAADWYADAFGFRIVSDVTRPVGDRFIRCQTEDGGLGVNFSSQRDGETLAPASVGVHLGLEHFGVDSTDIKADIARLTELGAKLEEGPNLGRGGQQWVAFLSAPHGVRVELIQKIASA